MEDYLEIRCIIYLFIGYILLTVMVILPKMLTSNNQTVFLPHFNCCLEKSTDTTFNAVNLTIVLIGGGLVPGALNSTMIISTDTISRCSFYNPSNPKSNLEKKFQFELTDMQKEILWSSIIENDFFSLDNEYNEDMFDGFFIEIQVTKDKRSHTVNIRNYHQKNVENIIKTINTFLPKEFRFKW